MRTYILHIAKHCLNVNVAVGFCSVSIVIIAIVQSNMYLSTAAFVSYKTLYFLAD